MRHRLLRVLVTFLPGFLIMYTVNIYVGILIFTMPLFIFYLIKTKSVKASLLYTFLDILLQIIYGLSFTATLIYEFIKRLKYLGPW